ncbi:gamma subclass chorismate mutase AroQ [Nonomuraea sp. MTCD27]|uniref:gamma subclass chorismate mutase AroQ n=1 Tax=Nonomuraea sp. MTCD27 TaxID=1676747 RepID=UPI0035C0CE97
MTHQARPAARHVAATAAVLLAVAAAPALPDRPRPPTAPRIATTPPDTVGAAPLAGPSGLPALAEVAARRLFLADAVAAAKFGGAGPITDPVRERELLASVAATSAEIGLPPDTGVRFFRAQIEAAKLVQRGLHARWRAYPELRPRERPDLATEVRPKLDRLTPRLLELLKATGPVRAIPDRCQETLAVARRAAGTRTRLDPLHRAALRVALTPVCRIRDR